MAKRYVPFPDSELDALVDQFFKARGIDINYVSGYTLKRVNGNITMINIEMYFEDVPSKKEGDDNG